MKKLIVFELMADSGNWIRLQPEDTARRAVERSSAVSQPLLRRMRFQRRDWAIAVAGVISVVGMVGVVLRIGGWRRIWNVYKMFVVSGLCIFARNSAWRAWGKCPMTNDKCQSKSKIRNLKFAVSVAGNSACDAGEVRAHGTLWKVWDIRFTSFGKGPILRLAFWGDWPLITAA